VFSGNFQHKILLRRFEVLCSKTDFTFQQLFYVESNIINSEQRQIALREKLVFVIEWICLALSRVEHAYLDNYYSRKWNDVTIYGLKRKTYTYNTILINQSNGDKFTIKWPSINTNVFILAICTGRVTSFIPRVFFGNFQYKLRPIGALHRETVLTILSQLFKLNLIIKA